MEEQTNYGFGVTTSLSYEAAVSATRGALATEGFGVLMEIDIRKTMREKGQGDFRPYIILGACNPPLAHRALSAELDLGLLLPCNVVVYEDDEGHAVVKAMDPRSVLGLATNPALQPIAAEVSERLQRVLGKIESESLKV